MTVKPSQAQQQTRHQVIFYSTMALFDGANCSSSGTHLTSCLYPWYIAAGVISAISCLLGIPANISVIIKLSRHLRGSSMSQRLFFNLALSDLLSLLCLLVGGLLFFTGPSLTPGLCRFLFFFLFFCITSSLNILVLISIQRYYQILHHAKWKKVNRIWQRILLFSVWTLAALLALPIVFSLAEPEPNNGLSCNSQPIPAQLEAIYIVFIVACHLVVLFYYQLLVRGLRKIKLSDEKKKKIAKLFSRIIAVSLVVGFLPLTAHVVYVTARLTESDKVLSVSIKLTAIECLYFLIHGLNPMLYFLASRDGTREKTIEFPHGS